MFERFTDRARKVMALANQEAQRFNHEYLGTEHMLLGLVKEGSGVGANVLKDLDIDPRQLRLEVEKLVKSGPGMVTATKLPQTPESKKAVQCAIEEARSLNHNYVGTEHLLLGLLCEHDGVAAQVLMNLGLTFERARAKVLDVLGQGVSPNETTTDSVKNRIDAIAGRSTDQKVQVLYERFTDRSRKVMALANQEAQRFNHEYIGTEHILLGLVKEGSGVGANVLKNLGIDLHKVRLEVEKFIKSGPEWVVTGKLPQTPRAKRVIEFAIVEARGLNHNYVGSEHLLLGLIEEHEGVAAHVLMNLGLTLEQLRGAVLNLLGAGVDQDQSEAAAAAKRSGWGMGLRGKPPRTPHARRVLEFADEEAVNMKHNHVGTQHILLGLFRDRECFAAQLLVKLGVSLEKLREEVLNLPGDESPPGEQATDPT